MTVGKWSWWWYENVILLFILCYILHIIITYIYIIYNYIDSAQKIYWGVLLTTWAEGQKFILQGHAQ